VASGEVPVLAEGDLVEYAGGPRERATITIEGGLEDMQSVAHARGFVKDDAERLFPLTTVLDKDVNQDVSQHGLYNAWGASDYCVARSLIHD